MSSQKEKNHLCLEVSEPFALAEYADATFGFKLPANPVGEGIMSNATVIHILPSPTGLAGNLNPKVALLC